MMEHVLIFHILFVEYYKDQFWVLSNFSYILMKFTLVHNVKYKLLNFILNADDSNIFYTNSDLYRLSDVINK